MLEKNLDFNNFYQFTLNLNQISGHFNFVNSIFFCNFDLVSVGNGSCLGLLSMNPRLKDDIYDRTYGMIAYVFPPLRFLLFQ